MNELTKCARNHHRWVPVPGASTSTAMRPRNVWVRPWASRG